MARRIILLDTNYLIRGLVRGSGEATQLTQWLEEEVMLVTSGIAWYEFLCGPVNSRQEMAIRAFISNLIPFGNEEAQEAVRLFNVVGRKRSLRVDAMIAATAICAKAALATENQEDFEGFIKEGLTLVEATA